MDNELEISLAKKYQLKGVLANARSMTDKALLIEKEVGTDALYTMVALKVSMSQIASSLNLSLFELKFVLKRTPEHRKKYINAVSFALAEDSAKTLKNFSDEMTLEQNQNFAAKHHSAMMDKALRILNAPTENGGGNILVNNTVIVRDASEVPELPTELQGEYDVVAEA